MGLLVSGCGQNNQYNNVLWQGSALCRIQHRTAKFVAKPFGCCEFSRLGAAAERRNPPAAPALTGRTRPLICPLVRVREAPPGSLSAGLLFGRNVRSLA